MEVELKERDGNISNADDLFKIYNEVKTSLILKDRKVGPIKFKNTFTGKNLVTYLTEKKNLTTKEANKFGDLLLSAGLITHCSSDSLPFSGLCWFTFQDSENITSLAAENEPEVKNIQTVQPTIKGLRHLSIRSSSYRKPKQEESSSYSPLEKSSLGNSLEENIDTEDKLQGWMEKKTYGFKTRKFWFEVEDGTEIVSYFADNPTNSKSCLVGTICLSNSVIVPYEKSGKFQIKIVQQNKKKHTLILKTEQDRNTWSEKLIRVRDSTKEQTAILDSLNMEDCKRCVTSDETESEATEVSESLPPVVVQSYKQNKDIWEINLCDYYGNFHPVKEIVGQKTTVIVLLRHFGCLICRQVAGKILAIRNKFEELGIQIIAVGSGAPQIAQLFAKEYHFPGAIYCDQKRLLYTSLGCRFGTKYLLNASGIEKAKIAYDEGYRQADKVTKAHGLHRQLGGAVALHAKYGTIFSHVDRYLGDSVNLLDLLEVLSRFCEENPADNWTSNTLHRNWNEFQDLKVKYKMTDGDEGCNYEYGISNVYDPPLAIIDNITHFQKYFYIPKTDHFSYIAIDADIGPLVITLEICSGDSHTLIWTKKGIWRRIVPSYEYSTNEQACDYLIKKLFPEKAKTLTLTKVKDPAFSEELLEVEKKCFFINYKFGVLLARAGRCSEDGMYDDLESSPDFDEFLEFIGTKVKLQGWEKFRGGLDNKRNTTGEYSYHTELEGLQIMYHVCPLIPYLEDDPSRKRYIGNDVVVIIFKEGKDDVFNPSIMHSQFNHIFVIVEKVSMNDDKTWYRVQLACKPGVPPFPPYLPDPPIFEKGPKFREYFLTKLINGERATIAMAKDFVQKMDRTRNQLLETLITTYLKKK